MDTRRNGFDKSMVIACGLMAIMGALAVMAVAFMVLGVDVQKADVADVVSIFTLIAGAFWGILVYRNC